MLAQQEQKHIPGQVPFESENFEDTLSHLLGAIRYDMTWDNQFPQFRLIMNTVNLVKDAIDLEAIDLSNFKELIPNALLVEKLDAIWNGGCCYCEIYDNNGIDIEHFIFSYGDPRYDSYANLMVRQRIISDIKKEFEESLRMDILENPTRYGINPFELCREVLDSNVNKLLNMDDMKTNVESMVNEKMQRLIIIKLPKLKGLIPRGSVDSDRWGVVVRTEWELSYAWEGVSYGDIVNDAEFYYYTAEGLIPKISPEDMGSEEKTTSVIATKNYDAVMDNYTYFMQKNWSKLSIMYQKILKAVRGGYVTIKSEERMNDILNREFD